MTQPPDDITDECRRRRHESCSGYTEPEWDADLCDCRCHEDAARAYASQA